MTAMTMTENRPVATVESGSWRLNVLGPVELIYDGTPVEVSGPTRTLLALLARTPGEEIGTPSLVAGLWGSEPPEDSEKEVASHVSRLRKALTVVAPNMDPTSVVVTMPTGYILAIQPSNADILAFERLAADGRRAISVGQPRLALASLDAALALWRGNAYEDFGEHAFARAEANRLEELRLAAIESRVDARLALAAPGVPAELVAELQALVADHWHRERLWGQLMTALFRLGRRSDALATHRRAQEMLAEGLRVQPGPELRAVERAVLDSDNALYGTPLRQRGTVPPALAGTVPACVGRDEEVQWLTGALDLAATRRAQARLVVGSPGTGKTRLMAEVAQRAAAARGGRAPLAGGGDRPGQPGGGGRPADPGHRRGPRPGRARRRRAGRRLHPHGGRAAGGHDRHLPRPGPGGRSAERAQAGAVGARRRRGGRDRPRVRPDRDRRDRRVGDGQRRRRAGPGPPGGQRMGVRAGRPPDRPGGRRCGRTAPGAGRPARRGRRRDAGVRPCTGEGAAVAAQPSVRSKAPTPAWPDSDRATPRSSTAASTSWPRRWPGWPSTRCSHWSARPAAASRRCCGPGCCRPSPPVSCPTRPAGARSW